MPRPLPPLSAIRGFAAAARHLSFRRAAEELCLTQSAVSHQVKALEDFLEVAVFERRPTGLVLTAAGRNYLRSVTAGLEHFETGAARVRDDADQEVLAVRGTPAFIARWLTPRIESFRAACPHIELHLTTGLPPTTFAEGGADVIVHWGTAPVPGVRIDPFLASTRFPVCSPALLEPDRPLETPADLGRTTLLHDMVEDAWPAWLERARVMDVETAPGPRFEHCELVLAAAERGQGVALAYAALIDREIGCGSLVRPFETATDPAVIYSLACLDGRAAVPKIAAFRDWVMAEVEAQPAPRRQGRSNRLRLAT